jgi:hypothetical protein
MNLERSLLMLAAVCLSSSLWASTTYNYKGSAYTSTVNFSACGDRTVRELCAWRENNRAVHDRFPRWALIWSIKMSSGV